MRQVLDVFVPGHPKTKGSLDFKGPGRVVENVAGSTTWRKLMAEAFKKAWRDADGKRREPFAGAVRVTATFYLPCPRGPRSLIAKQSGDVDKLTRNLLDALAVDETGHGLGAGVIDNDCQVVGVVVEKREATPGAHESVSASQQGTNGRLPQGVYVQVWSV